MRRTRKANLQKKYQPNYQEFESFKSLQVASKSQDWLDKKTLELFAKLKEVWPRIFKRLEKLSNRYSQKQICSGTQNGKVLFTWQQGRFSTKIFLKILNKMLIINKFLILLFDGEASFFVFDAFCIYFWYW